MKDALTENQLISLAEEEGWEIGKKQRVGPGEAAFYIKIGTERLPLLHPAFIHLRFYRKAKASEVRFEHLKRAHDLLWPEMADTWNYWDERRFNAHCMNYRQIVLAGGASSGKSDCIARVALLFWLSDPQRHTCIVASTTLESLESRIWGYVARYFHTCAVDLPASYLRGKPPKILSPNVTDKIHGMFAVAIRQGEEQKVLSTLIGRHPKRGLLMVLDEATDMSPSIIKSIPNLEDVPYFQLWAIGNSSDRNDLHGSLATPKNGWESVDPNKNYVWETMQHNSICLYFNPLDSPAIHEEDPVRKEKLGRFLITSEDISEKRIVYGEGSDSYFRFVLGFWKPSGMGNTLLTEPFLREHQVTQLAEWSGFYPLQVVAGLDPAYQTGGDDCVLRLGILGQTSDGTIRIDFRGEQLLFRIPVTASAVESAELQVAKRVLEKLKEFGCPVRNLAVDATGAGRALGELLRLLSDEQELPWRIIMYARGGQGVRVKSTEPKLVTSTPTDLWTAFREFVQTGQIRGVDALTLHQIITRLLVQNSTGRLVLEPKAEYKARLSAINPKMGSSPDEADACMLCLQSAILQFGFTPGQRRDLPAGSITDFAWQKQYAFQVEQQEASQSGRFSTRAPLLPNFAAPAEDLPKDADYLPRTSRVTH